MSSSPYRLPPVDLRADDAEIGNYAALLDSLDIGLLVFAPDGFLRLCNSQAEALLGDAPALWEDENGQPLAPCDRLELRVAQTRAAVTQRALGLRNEKSGNCTRCQASAFPVFAEDGGLRRVLLILADVDRYKRLATSGDRQLLTHDPLTGVFNRHHIALLLDEESRRARRYGTPFSLALISLDHRSGFANSGARESEERILCKVGELLVRSLREFDMVGRFGAEDFLVILPNVRVNDAMVGLERLRELVEAMPTRDSEPRLTISGGVTEYTGEDPPALIERVRSLLVNAREAGCNRLCVDLDIF